MTDHFVRTGGLDLHYLDHAGHEPALVLLPGLTANAHIFDGLIRTGLSPRFRVLAPDLRGRGRSGAPPAGLDPAAPAANYTMADHAADVVGLLDGLGVACPVLVGHSFGGMLALYLAAHFPERFGRLVVLDWAHGLAGPATRELLRPTLSRLGQVVPFWDDYLAAMKRMPFFHGWWDPTIESFYRADVRTNPDGSVQPRARPDAIGAALEGALREDWPALLAKVRQPVLLLNGQGPYGPPGAPSFVPRAQALATAAALADCLYVAVPGNHITMLYGGSPHPVVEAITAFVKEALPPAPRPV
jgi:pimeloyl-ACP methyl ester carboxylesterase